VPAEKYRPSPRQWREHPPPWDYEAGCAVERWSTSFGSAGRPARHRSDPSARRFWCATVPPTSARSTPEPARRGHCSAPARRNSAAGGLRPTLRSSPVPQMLQMSFQGGFVWQSAPPPLMQRVFGLADNPFTPLCEIFLQYFPLHRSYPSLPPLAAGAKIARRLNRLSEGSPVGRGPMGSFRNFLATGMEAL
jgi:hypothetical protein